MLEIIKLDRYLNGTGLGVPTDAKPGQVGAHTRCPAARSLLATGCQAHPPCHAPCTRTKFSDMVISSSRVGFQGRIEDDGPDERVGRAVQGVVGG